MRLCTSTTLVASRSVLFTFVVVVAASGCAGARQVADRVPDVITVRDLDASGDGTVYFSLATGAIVAANEAWDISFAGSSIGVSGEGRILDRAFDRVVEAPDSGYRRDEEGSPALAGPDGERWFDYDPNTHVVSPVPFRTLVVRTTSGHYAKVEILDYYDGMGTPRFYTFRYALQTSKSRILGAATS